jgi:hypothetical protein
MNATKRYDGVRVDKTSIGKQFYSSIIYPTIDPDPNDIYTMVYESDRLDLLAYKYYGDVRYWWIIAQANSLGKGSLYVTTDSRVRIPKNIDKIISDYETLNKNR